MTQSQSRADAHDVKSAPTIKPHRTMFWLLMIVFIAWVMFLLAMYFTTVAPRQDRAATEVSLRTFSPRRA